MDSFIKRPGEHEVGMIVMRTILTDFSRDQKVKNWSGRINLVETREDICRGFLNGFREGQDNIVIKLLSPRIVSWWKVRLRRRGRSM